MQKIVKLNRALLYCCMVVLFCLHFTGYAAPRQGKPVSITIKNSSLAEVLRQVSKKSGLYIYFQDADLAAHKSVTIDVKNKPVENVLHELLDGRGFSWVEVSENTIAVKKKPEIEEKKVEMDTVSTITVTGKVVDEKGEPIVGATVLIKDRKIGTTTNAIGTFSLERVPGNAVLMISSISYIAKDILVKNRRNIGTAQLSKYVGQLDETVVLAYTKTTTRYLTGNVSKVKARDIQNSPVSNPLLAAAGRIPGVTINQASGFAGSGVEVIIQGLNSLQRGSAPFYVIDGVPYAQALLPNLGNILKSSGRGAGDGPTNGSPLSYINPADIESIEILKDADATAIYGSRAANGAIIITTKRGKSGDLKVDVNIQRGFGEVGRKLDLLNTKEYLDVRNEALKNDNLIPGDYDYDLNGSWDSTKYTDWQKKLIGNKAAYTDVQVGISGGGLNAQYLIGTSYHKERTVFPTKLSDEKGAVRFNLDVSSPDKKFRSAFSGSYMIDNNRLPNGDLTQFAMILPPNLPDLTKSNGDLSWGTNGDGISTISFHPYASLTSIYLNKTENIISNVVLSYTLFDGLDIKSSFGYTSLQTDETSTEPSTILAPEYRQYFNRTASYGFNKISSWIVEPQVSYVRKIKQGELNVLLGGSLQQSNSNRKLISGSGYSSDLVLENINAATSLNSPAGSAIMATYKYNAAFFQVGYNWDRKYIVNVSGRRDGSSRFGLFNRFHNFGSIGLAWIFSNERWITQNFPFLSYGKLKGSYGSTGNDQIGNYRYLSLYSNRNPEIPYRGGSALSINTIPNPYLQWEATKKRSIGLDIGVFNDNILLGFNYYRNTSSNMLIVAPLPATAGPTGGLIANLPATIKNSGFEISFHSNNLSSNGFAWSTNFNLTVPKNKLTAFDNLRNSVYANTYVVGYPSNLVRLFHSNGVNSKDGKYEFIDKDGKVTSDPSSNPENYNKYIDPNPKYYGGLSNTVSFKGISLDFLFQFVKHFGYNERFGAAPGFGQFNQVRSVLDRWQKGGDVKSTQRYTTSDPDLLAAFNNQYLSDAYWEDASFIRLKNVNLSYAIPQRLVNRIKVQSCRLYISGQNLLTITPYKGLDPESLSNFSLPPLRVYTFGVQISL